MVLKKIQDKEATILTTLPLRPAQAWFPKALHLLAETLLLFPRNSLIVPQNPSFVHLQTQTLILTSMILSGKLSKNWSLSPEVAGFLLSLWRQSTKLQYGSHIRRWVSFCLCRKMDPFSSSLSFLLDFLLLKFKKEKGCSYSSMNTIWSTISAVACIDDQPAGRHLLVNRFMRAVFQKKPSLAWHHTTRDPEAVLNNLKHLDANENLSISQLLRKLAIFMLLTSGQCGLTLHLLDTRSMSIFDTRVSFRIGDPLKTSRPGDHMLELVFDAYVPDSKICVHSAILHYLDRIKDTRGDTTRFFLATKRPVTLASRDTLNY